MAVTSDCVVNARGLCKTYQQTRVVDGIDLHVEEGECFGLLGPNGAGKTTTLRMFLGHTRPDSGDLVVLDHQVPAQARSLRALIGVVPQADNLDPDFTVVENLLSYGRYFGIPRAELRQYVPELLEFANLDQKKQAKIDTLSGGMKRRLTLARALVNNPRLLILDEPTTGLDPQARQHIWQRLRQLRQEGRSLILTTHYMEEAQRLCNRLAIMDHGQIIAVGSPNELILNHVESHVIEVFGDGLESWLTQYGQRADWRVERVGETVLVYGDDETEILKTLAEQPDVQFLHRHANLEDVFLRLTGRELRE